MRRKRLIADNTAMLAQGIVAVFVVVAGMMATPGPAAAGEYPADFISALGNQGLAVIRSNAAIDQKAAYFHQMLRQDFDLARISRFGLGPYWRAASEREQQEFSRLLVDHLEPDHSPAGPTDRGRLAARPQRWPLQDRRRHRRRRQHGADPTLGVCCDDSAQRRTGGGPARSNACGKLGRLRNAQRGLRCEGPALFIPIGVAAEARGEKIDESAHLCRQ